MKDLPPAHVLADRLGAATAVVYIQLYDLYRKQRRLQKHFHDGRYWVRMPYDDFPRMFPGLQMNTVYESIVELEDEGLIRMVHYGRLSWYAMIHKRIGVSSKKRSIL